MEGESGREGGSRTHRCIECAAASETADLTVCLPHEIGRATGNRTPVLSLRGFWSTTNL